MCFAQTTNILKKLIYDVMHVATLKKFNNEKYSNKNVNGIVKIDVEDEERVKDEKKPESNSSDWKEKYRHNN